jgi:hypothetical protein
MPMLAKIFGVKTRPLFGLLKIHFELQQRNTDKEKEAVNLANSGKSHETLVLDLRRDGGSMRRKQRQRLFRLQATHAVSRQPYP